MSFAENVGKNISKSLNSKYSEKLLNHAKQSETDAFKTSLKILIQKAAKVTGDLIGNKLLIKLQESQKTSPHNNLETNEEILREKTYPQI